MNKYESTYAMCCAEFCVNCALHDERDKRCTFSPFQSLKQWHSSSNGFTTVASCSGFKNREEDLTEGEPAKPKSALDAQVGGGHYKDFAIQPVEFTHKNKLNFCQGNIIKYTCRYKAKNGLEDLKKVKHYVDLLIELEGYNEGEE